MTERLDGNAIAGIAFSLFGRELTVATGVCGACGKSSLVAELHVYVGAGLVARCPACEAVLLRIVEGSARSWLDLSGLATLEVAS
jgi:hypothetical protein